ncbi:MAG: LysM peptidoglycan-binding domain-containing protein [Gammaproteobacteria bacterium]|nr:LysM peptidoglycan-binding domain-containing protein [Gammaproteobacteria bacterium]
MRNLGLIISFWLAAISLTTNALALGLGEIAVNSFLNQPLKAEIEVISARAGEIDDLLVGLASKEAFTRAGLSRHAGLFELRFTVKKSEEADSAVILITTKAAIKEPFLNFLVEADWSKGRVLREFTILLDPPFYADSPAPAPQPEQQSVAEAAEPEIQAPQAVAEPSESSAVSDTEPSTVSEPIALSEPESTPVEQPDQDTSDITEVLEMVESVDTEIQADTELETGDITIAKGDTLWSIAADLQGSDYSMSQIMLAIQQANPDAFTDNNINNMKAGSVLRIPHASAMGEIDHQDAYAQVLEQNGLWDDYVARVTGVPAVSTEITEADSAAEAQTQETEPSGELNLLTPGDGESDAAGLQNEGEDANELRVKLALAEEELDASRIDNQEQESRIAELEARLSKFEELQKMVEIEDDSLAQLQSDQAQDSEQGEEETAISETINEQQQLDDQDALLEEVLGEDNAATEDSSTPVTANDSDTMQEDALTESTTEPDAVADEQGSTPPVPVIVTEVEPEPSISDGIIPDDILDMLGLGDALPSGDSLAFDPILLGGLGAIILSFIGLVIYRRTKSDDSDDDDILINDPIFASDDDEGDDLTPIHLAEEMFEGLEDEFEFSVPDADATQLTELMDDDNEDDLDDFAQTAIVSKVDMPVPEMSPSASATDEQDDILNEADVYLAYNLYDNAEELLTQSLEASPERADYRSKLLDTHFATKNSNAFIREAEVLKSMGEAASRYWDRVQVMGYELEPGNALFAAAKDSSLSAADLEISKPAEADFDLGSSEDDTSFSITDFDLGEEDTNTFDAMDSAIGDPSVREATESEELFDIDDIVGDDATDINVETDAPDDIDDLDFSLDEAEDSVEEMAGGTDSVEFALPDELDLGSENDVEATAVIEAGTAVVDTSAFAAELENRANEAAASIDATAVMEVDDAVEHDIDFGMADTALIQQIDEGDGEIELDLGALDDDDSLSIDLEMDSETPKTGTFAPGDFEDLEDIAGADGFDDIEDLMLPDDVDEVSTKLDLARAFIDMGDAEGARSSLDEVMSEGNDEQKTEAQSLFNQL